MVKLLGSLLTGLIVLQAGLPSLGLDQPLSNIAALVVSVAVAAISYYIKPPTPPTAVV